MQSSWQGTLCKMGVEHHTPVSYRLRDAFRESPDQPLNDLLGQRLRLVKHGPLRCVDCGQTVKKHFGEGSCYRCFSTLPANDICIVKPELCHFHKPEDPCRDPAWGERTCFQPHYLYIALSSGLKVGITRQVNIPTRWIDQGASQAMPLAMLPSRFAVGRLEKALSAHFSDRTNWQRMLKHEVPPLDLAQEAERVVAAFPDEFREFLLADRPHYRFDFPHQAWPAKVRSHNLEKEPQLEGTLTAIKGQYLLLDSGVINIRSHSGTGVRLEVL
jgi:hypothetical protein